MRRYLISAAAFGLLASAGQAAAIEFTLDLNSLTSTSTNSPATGASGSILFDVTDTTGGVDLNLTITNTTGTVSNPSDAGATEGRLTGFFFDTVLDLQLASSTLGAPLNQLETGFFLPGVSNGSGAAGDFSIGICHQTSCQNGQPNNALDVGDSSTALLTFTTSSTADVVAQTLLNAFNTGDAHAALRFQAVNAGAGSDKLLFGDVGAVPLPATLPLLLGALGVLGFGMSRKRSA